MMCVGCVSCLEEVGQGNNDRAFRDGTWQTGSTVYAEIFVCEIPRGLNFRGFRG